MSDIAEMRERVAVALQEAWDTGYLSDPASDRLADAVLAALGLDDLDAAVERAGEALRVEQGTRLDFARAALEAALTPPEDDWRNDAEARALIDVIEPPEDHAAALANEVERLSTIIWDEFCKGPATPALDAYRAAMVIPPEANT